MRYSIGSTYTIDHSRKGKFALRVTGDDGEFLTGVIVSGTARALLSENVRHETETVTVRKSLITSAVEAGTS